MNYYKLQFSLFLIRRHYCVNSSKKVVQSVVEQKKLKNLVPKKSVQSKIDSRKLPPRTKIDVDTIALLERLSLVNCANRQGIETLEEAIAFADRIQQIDTEGVQPLVTVLEDFPLEVRQEDKPIETNKQKILENAAVTEDDYFVAPPGNIPLEPREDLLHEKEIEREHNRK
ncbi:glutamyl-tRNA(Gln) amidotransferase subunit C, mitochondrial-like [Agrilus planipennis]|uniref:Glutamyl-tRNA(Gln) amidotransferase subunit C, mitochondrial n=1 Tax=Agrilus planipennis TaxID=224129 RepID=A0A7F5RMQ3_AGRPL|nr:glutamyl-tRNA(Gln) amidotransferase subunit C, mitochondrial-like [Agrilus planipennis]